MSILANNVNEGKTFFKGKIGRTEKGERREKLWRGILSD
jgi:hypothetical protein